MSVPFDITFARPGWLWLLAFVPVIVLIGYLAGRRRGMNPASIWLRGAAVALLVLTLAEPLWSSGSAAPATVLVIDRSASLSNATTSSLVDWLNTALGQAGSSDRAAVVTFGGNAVVDQMASDADELQIDFASSGPIDSSVTDIAGAISMARMLPVGDSRRIVLISDGAENTGTAIDQAAQASADGVPIDVLAVDGIGSHDLRIDSVSAPEKVWLGEPMTVQANVVASEDGSGTIALLAGGEPVSTQEVDFRTGLNTYTFTVDALPAGFHQLDVTVDPGTSVDSYTETTASSLAPWCETRRTTLRLPGGCGQFLSDSATGIQGGTDYPGGSRGDS
ncbi:MAG: VWA domain-containing protein [Thermomicrobiales bacterium]|nr:VWA domain-containing protein [Thermomicrobiales bacterium]